MALFESHQDCSLVIDPAHAMRSAEGFSELLDRLRARGPALHKVVLYADPTPEALRGVCALASATACAMVVRGVDDSALSGSVCAQANEETSVDQLLDEVSSRLAALPRFVRERWIQALRAPRTDSVKRIAAESGVARRSMERMLSDCGLPAPGKLLALARAAHAIDRLRDCNDTLKTVAEDVGWRDVRSLRRALRRGIVVPRSRI